MSETTQPIVVNESPIPDNIMAGMRQILLAAGAWAAGRGYLEGDTATALATILLVIVPFAYGQYKTWVRGGQLAFLARRAPDKVAVTK